MKHLFAKVPLKDDPNFASVNEREKVMLTTVLPQMQEYLDTECEGFFRLPMPEVIYCYYDGKGEILEIIIDRVQQPSRNRKNKYLTFLFIF